MPGIGVVVVAGGAGRRAGGVDKALLLLDGRPLLAHVLDGVRAAAPPDSSVEIVVVGPPRPGFSHVSWTLEAVPGSGPMAAVAAGVAALGYVEQVLLLGGDMPYVSRGIPALLEALRVTEVAVLEDDDGYDQPLASAWRHDVLAGALADVGAPEGVPLRRLLDHVMAVRIPAPDGATADVDTLEDLRAIDSPE